MAVKQQCHVQITNGFATFENFDESVNISENWGSVRDTIYKVSLP
jgi:hypothetical protein